MVVDRYHVIQI